MMRFIKINLLFFALSWLSGCIEPYDLKVDDQDKILVVNGLITDEPGPYVVKLSTTSNYGAFFNNQDPALSGALISITDETGFSETLSEKNPSEYVTDPVGIQGRTGGKYTLRIRLKDGREYISETEVMPQAQPIERLYAIHKPVLEVNEQGQEVTKSYVQFLLDAKDPGAEKNYYRWNYKATYEVSTQPENFTTVDKNGNAKPAPKPCCRQCWISEINYKVNVINDRQFNGNKLIGQQVATVPFSPMYFENKYYIEVKQLSITESAYNFWETLNAQISGTGSIQEPAPANAFGNIRNVSNPSERVLGFFSAAGVSKKNMFLQSHELGMSAGNFIFPDDCRVITGATTTRPSFW